MGAYVCTTFFEQSMVLRRWCCVEEHAVARGGRPPKQRWIASAHNRARERDRGIVGYQLGTGSGPVSCLALARLPVLTRPRTSVRKSVFRCVCTRKVVWLPCKFMAAADDSCEHVHRQNGPQCSRGRPGFDHAYLDDPHRPKSMAFSH